MFIKYTYVDSKTGISVTVEPAKNGPTNPAIPELAYGFGLESQFPTDQPIFYGSCKDGISANIPGLLSVVTEPEYTKARDDEMRARLSRAKLAKFEELKQRRKASELKGIQVTQIGSTTLPVPISIPCELDDQTRITAVLTNMNLFPEITPISFKANGNAFVQVTYEEVKQIAYLVSRLIQACFDNERLHTVAISALTKPEDVMVYNVSTGWPN